MNGSRLIVKAMLSMVLGWYLLLPPGFTEGPRKGLAETTAPLSRWGVFRSYDSAAECERFLADIQQQARNAVAADPTDTVATIVVYSTGLSLCVSTDDPRLRY